MIENAMSEESWGAYLFNCYASAHEFYKSSGKITRDDLRKIADLTGKDRDVVYRDRAFDAMVEGFTANKKLVD